jgi:microcystin-dependent protein
MAGFDHSILTNVGWDALADALNGQRLTFTTMSAGDGVITGGDTQMQGMTQLVHRVMDFAITSASDDGQGQVTLIGTLSSKNNVTGAGFYFRELGVMATIDNGPALLYTVANNTTPDYIPVSTDTSVVIESMQVVVKIDRTVTPTINIVPGGDVTAANIGLASAGAGLYRDKIAQVLNFKRFTSSSQTIGITDQGDTLSIDAVMQNLIPAGVIWEFGGSSIPSGWLACDGSLVSRTTYSRLFAVISTTFGPGDGVNTFTLPDYRGRMSMGVGSGVGLTPRALGDQGGYETVSLTVAQMPAHSHTASGTQPGHTHSIYDPGHDTTFNDPSHQHPTYDPTHAHSINNSHPYNNKYGFDNTSGYIAVTGEAPDVSIGRTASGPTGTAGAGTGVIANWTGTRCYNSKAWTGIQTYAAGSDAVTVSVANTGGGAPHSIIQPFLCVTKMIKT